MNGKDTSFTIRFAPEQVLADAETQMRKAFQHTCSNQIDAFFSDKVDYRASPPIKVPGAGLLLIRDFLEKKFDDPKTQARMDAYFEHNFERIMEETMQKALQHKANAFVFGKAAKAEVKQV